MESLEENSAPKSKLLNSRIVLFLVSQNVSLFGSSVVGYAVIWYITLETSSGFWLMLATICYLLPMVFVSLWGGVWADRYNRKYLIMLADAFTALSTLGLALAFLAGYRSLELILVVSVIRSLGMGIQTPAVSAIYPQLVPQEKLMRVQGINQTLNSVLLLAAPAVGGVILGSMDIVWAFMLDVITAAAAIVIVSFIKVGKIERADTKTSVFTEFKQGLHYTFSHPILRGLVICYLFTFFLVAPAAILSPLLVARSFGEEVWKLMVNEIAWTSGMLIGGICIAVYGNIKNKVRVLALSLVAFGITFVLLGLAGNFTLFLIFMVASGMVMPIFGTTQTVLIQEITEPSMMGRVFSIVQIIASSAMPVGILLFGPLADIISVESIFIISGVLLALVGVLYRRYNKRLVQT